LALLAAYVEEVRVGFDHWAEKPAIEEVMKDDGMSDDMAHAKVFLLSRTALAYKEQGDQHPSVFLIFPASSKVLDKDQDLLTIKSAPVGSVLVDESREPITIDLQALLDNDKVVANGDATIPDFVRYFNVTIMNPKVLVGMFMGVMLAFVFCALTMKAVGRAANAMVEEVRRQFREIKGIMEYKAEPDYAACVDISTAAAQKEMIIPAMLGLFGPIIVGMLLGVEGVMGMLAGGLTSGFAMAIFMANAGGSWDNAKKYVEAGAHGGKGTEAHKATVVGDTVGDPFKDTSGPSLNILIKLMSMVSVVFAGLVVQYTIQNLF
jgi:inorganic pyrophosphatase/K(+)-stimulated pyrophosphate-energized sodium pump